MSKRINYHFRNLEFFDIVFNVQTRTWSMLNPLTFLLHPDQSWKFRSTGWLRDDSVVVFLADRISCLRFSLRSEIPDSFI